MTRALLACAVILSSACSAASDAKRPTPEATTVCSLIENPRIFDKKLVSVTATVKAAAHYSLVASDGACGSETITLAIPPSLDTDPNVDILRKEVFVGYPQYSSSVRAQLIGEFQWYSDKVPSRVLALTDVSQVENEGAMK